MNSTRSAPDGPSSSRGSSSTEKEAPSIASADSSSEHPLGQLRRRLARASGELGGDRGSLAPRFGQRLLGALEGHLGVLEPIAIRPAALGVLQHRLDRAAVLALEPVVDVQALLHVVQPLGIGVEPVEVAAQLRAQVLGLDPQAAHALGERVQLGVGAGHAVGQPLGLRQQGRGAGPVVGRDRLAARGRRGAQAVDLPQPPALGLQTGLLLGGGRQLLDLLDLEREQAEVAVAAAGAVAQAPPGRAPPPSRARGRAATRLAQLMLAPANASRRSS